MTKLRIITAQSGIPVLNPTQLLKINQTNFNKNEKSLQETVNFQQKANELQKVPVNSTINARYLYQSLNPQVNEPRAHSSGHSTAQHTNNQQEIVKRADKTAATSNQCLTQQGSNARSSFDLSKVLRNLNKIL